MPRGFPDSWGTYAAGKIWRNVRGSASRAYRAGARATGGSNHYSYKFSRLNLYRPILNAYLKTPAGPLWRTLQVRGRITLVLARRQVGVDTGALKRSITMSHKTTSYGQELKIGSENKIAYLHHEGTRPHLITPKNAPQLVFMSKGRIIRTQLVRHPGTKPNRYLSDQLFVFQDLGAVYRGKSFPKVK
jgi:hypothetical protein